MSSTYERYVSSPMGRTFLFSTILVLVFGYLAILLPLAAYNPDAWYSFLYQDPSLEDAERFNLILVIVESLVLSLFYFFLVLVLGSYAEIQNRLPSWGEVFLAAIITLVLSYLFPQVSVAEVTSIAELSAGYNHFTTRMQTWTFVGTLIGVILSTLYMIYSEPAENE